MKRYSFCHKDTGVFAAHVYSATDPELALNTPADHIPIEGAYDHLAQRVDVQAVETQRQAHAAAHVAAHAEMVARARAAYVPAIAGEVFKEPPPPAFVPTAAVVVDYTPPQPSADHEWNADLRRWVLTAAVQSRQAAQAAARAEIVAAESASLRTLREALLGDQAALVRLRAVDARIAELRRNL